VVKQVGPEREERGSRAAPVVFREERRDIALGQK
jgi:hypothetical protein